LRLQFGKSCWTGEFAFAEARVERSAGGSQQPRFRRERQRLFCPARPARGGRRGTARAFDSPGTVRIERAGQRVPTAAFSRSPATADPCQSLSQMRPGVRVQNGRLLVRWFCTPPAVNCARRGLPVSFL